MAAQSSDTSCLNLLRELDKDRYIAAILSPADKREALASLYCFNAEIARIRDVTREILPGEMRLQWWRDCLEGKGQGDAKSHPVVAGLLNTIATYHLPVKPLLDLIDARTFDLYDDSFDTFNSLEGYAGETASAIIQLACLILDPKAAASSGEIAGHAGVAQAMAGILLLMPLHRSRQQLYVPNQILAAAGLSRDEFLRGEDKSKMAAVIDIFAGHALSHLDKARAHKLPKSLAPAFYPAAITEPVLKAVTKLGGNVFDTRWHPGPLKRQWSVLKAHLRQSL